MVDLLGSRWIWLAHVGCSSIRTDREGSHRILWMISGMIKVV